MSPRPQLLGALGVCLGLTLSAGCRTVVAPTEPWRSAPLSAAYELPDLERVLALRVDEAGNVDYGALAADRDALERFYAQIARISPDSHPELFAGDDARLAYWINAYNAAVLVSVVRSHPIASVEDVRPPWYLFFLPRTAGFFTCRLHVFGARRLSLRALRDGVVRARFRDPRIHFALNGASAGCPRLPRLAFRARDLSARLDEEARRFFAEERNLRIDHDAGTVHLSQVLEWFESDFTAYLEEQAIEPASLLEYAALYAEPRTAAELRGRASSYQIQFVPFDWRLNARGLVR